MRDEVPLSKEPPRLDYLLLLQGEGGEPGSGEEDDATTLRRLWPMLPRVSVVEYKSPTHAYRSRHLDRLWGYVHFYFASEDMAPAPEGAPDSRQSLPREDLAAVLVVAHRTPTLDGDVANMGLTWEDCGGGYWRVRGGLFALYVVELDVAGPSDGDDLLYSLGHGKPTTAEARRFWMELVGSKEAGMSVQEMEGYDELMQKFLDSLPPEEVLSHYAPEQRLAGLPPEQRLAGLPPEQRLADLDRDHRALALPLDVLRVLPDEYLRSLSPEVEAELRRRLAQNGH